MSPGPNYSHLFREFGSIGWRCPRSSPFFPRSFGIRRPAPAALLRCERPSSNQEPAMRISLLFIPALCAFATVALAAPTRDDDILAGAHRTLLEFRAGNTGVAKPLVATLEPAVAKPPDNPRLWEVLGHAYMAYQGSMYEGPPDIPALISAGQHARDAYARSLAL